MPITRYLQHGNEFLGNAISEFCRKELAVGIHHRIVAKDDGCGVLADMEEAPEMSEKADVFPPAGGVAGRQLAGWRAIAECGEMDGDVAAGGEFEK